MSDEMIEKGRGFLNCLFEASADAPTEIQEIVKQTISLRKPVDLCRYYEVIDKKLVDKIVEVAVDGAEIKMRHDVEAHQLGSTSLEKLIRSVAMFCVITAAALAKEKKL